MLIEVEITGETPLMVNRFTEEAAEAASSGSRRTTAGQQDSPEDQCRKLIYYSQDGEGRYVMPRINLTRCLMEGGRFHKIGKKQVTTKESTLFTAAARVLEEEVDIQSPEEWTVDSRPVRIPATGGRIIKHRPKWHIWKMAFTIKLNTKRMEVALLRAIIDDAGECIGLGDFRPDRKGECGIFKVTKWVVKKDEKAAPSSRSNRRSRSKELASV